MTAASDPYHASKQENSMTATPSIVELKPRITVIGVGGGGNAVNNMTAQQLAGVDFVAANNDVPALSMVQLGDVTEGLWAGSIPQVGYASAEETLTEIMDHLTDSHMCFVTAGMADGTGTGAGPVIAQAARKRGILTVAVVTKPFAFEGSRLKCSLPRKASSRYANVQTRSL